MENTALILIVSTNIILVLILGLLTFLIYKLIKKTQHSPSKDKVNDSNYHPAILNRMAELKKVDTNTSLFCPYHPNEPGEATCAICDQYFCKSCIKPFKTLNFCKEHIPLVMKHVWEEVTTLKTSTQFPEEGVKLYDFKRDLFKNDQIPTYIETHYKINIDQDYIETYLVLFSTQENNLTVKNKLKQTI